MSTAAGTEQIVYPTRREWAAERGLCQSLEEQKARNVRGGGRLPKAAHDAIEKAKAEGQKFSD